MSTSTSADRVDIAPTISISGAEERRVILASSLGTVFEWYDFYIYATLAPFFAGLFFPPGNQTAALMSAFATYAAGFLVRPFGAIVFGRVGDLVGRKYTFLVTIVVMGMSTFVTGLLPTFAAIGWTAPLLLVLLRLLQGLALGGEYGGAATYVAEHAPHDGRGRATSWIQTTATVGLILSLVVILTCRESMDTAAFASWGWRIPFLLSLILLAWSLYIRLKLNESPVFQRMKQENRGSKSPLTDSFLRYPNNRYVLLALLGACAGQAVVWYTGQFYALFFLTITLHLDYQSAYTLLGAALVLATPFFIVFGWLSDRIGRLKIILGGCLIAALTFFPLFRGLTYAVNPGLAEFQSKAHVTVAADNCNLHIFVGPWTTFSACDRVKSQLTSAGVSFTSAPAVSGKEVVTTVNDQSVEGFDAPKLTAALTAAGWKGAPDRTRINWGLAFVYLFIMALYVTAVYGPIAAFLVEMFPARIRYTSMSLPYHIGNGWFGGLLPLVATALAAWSGDIYFGLWYPVVFAAMTVVIGFLFLRENRDVDIHA
jgi:MFS family permease